MNNRVFWGAIALAVAGILAAASIGDAARRLPNRDGVLIAGHDGVDQQMVNVDDSGNVQVEAAGGVASGATDSGNPVKIGGVYRATKPTLADGQRGDLQLGTRGSLNVQILSADATTQATVGTPSDGLTNTLPSLAVLNLPELFNGTSWDRYRNNTDITLLASAARTATTASSDLTNYNGTGVHVVIDVTAASATPSVVCTIQGKDALSSQYYTILASAAITGTGTTVLRVFPAATAAANTVANDIIPRTWRLNCVHADGDSITYSIGASVIL